MMSDGGSIILIGSVGTVKGFPTRSTYNGAKAALGAFVRTWTNELKGRNIRANVLSPGAIQTSLLDSQWSSNDVAEQTKSHLLSITPLGRLAVPRKSRRWRCSSPPMKAVSSPAWTYTSTVVWPCHEHRLHSDSQAGRQFVSAQQHPSPRRSEVPAENVPIMVFDGVPNLPPEANGAVVVGGSNAAIPAAYVSAKAGVRAAIHHDCGIGRDEAGVSGLLWAEHHGMAMAAVAADSARVGDGADMLQRGIISRVNGLAAQCG
jgi:hypothetical protein